MGSETLEPDHVVSELGIANLDVYQRIMSGISLAENPDIVLGSD